jgi:hypothetical protein
MKEGRNLGYFITEFAGCYCWVGLVKEVEVTWMVKPLGKKALRKLRRRWKDVSDMFLREMGCEVDGPSSIL